MLVNVEISNHQVWVRLFARAVEERVNSGLVKSGEKEARRKKELRN